MLRSILFTGGCVGTSVFIPAPKGLASLFPAKVMKYSPTQLRDPAGTSTGGQFAKDKNAPLTWKDPKPDWDQSMRDEWEHVKDLDVKDPRWQAFDQRCSAVRKAGYVWDESVLMAVSEGKLSVEDAVARKWRPMEADADDYKPLPTDLYHVTTAADAVAKDGLKSRSQLAQSSGVGLGGGSDTTVSFTTDPRIAKGIYDGIMLAHDYFSGKITTEDLVDRARKGDGGSTPFLSDLAQLNQTGYRIPYPGTDISLSIYDTIHGTRSTTTWAGWTPGMPTGAWDNQYDSEYRAVATTADGRQVIQRPATPKEAYDSKADFLKAFLIFRESKGGPLDPLFFSSDLDALGKISPDQIKVMQFAPVSGGMGYKVSGLGEWRTHSGKAVTLTQVFDDPNDLLNEPVLDEVQKFDEAKHPRDRLGRFAETYNHRWSDDQIAPLPKRVGGGVVTSARGPSSPSQGPSSASPKLTDAERKRFMDEWSAKAQWQPYQYVAREILSGVTLDEFVKHNVPQEPQPSWGPGVRARKVKEVMDAYKLVENLLGVIEQSPVGKPLYRGVQSQFAFRVGDTFSESLSSWTGRFDLAVAFATGHYGLRNPDAEYIAPVVFKFMRVDNAKGLSVSKELEVGDSELLNADEWLTSGEYKVTRVTPSSARELNPYTEIEVTRIGPAVINDIVKEERVEKRNKCHVPGGSSAGGQFCSSSDGNGGSGVKTDTPAFKRWFGDSVVTEGGTPKVVYHGTRKDFGVDPEFEVPTTGLINNQLGVHVAYDPRITDAFTVGAYARNDNYDPWNKDSFRGLQSKDSHGYDIVVKPGGYVLPVYVAADKILKVPQQVYPSGVVQSDQDAIACFVGATVFRENKDMFVEYAAQRLNAPAFEIEAAKVWERLSKNEPVVITSGSLLISVPKDYIEKNDGDGFRAFVDNYSAEFGPAKDGKEWGTRVVDEFLGWADKKGYQAMEYQNTSTNEVGPGIDPTCLIVFDTKKIKSAVGNRGTYDDSTKILKVPSLARVLKENPYREPAGSSKGGQYAKKPGYDVSEISDEDFNLLNELDYAESGEEVGAMLKRAGAQRIDRISTDTNSVYVVPDYDVVVEWDGKDAYPDHTDTTEWLNNANVDDYFPDAEDQFNRDFWEYPGTLYHNTQPGYVPDILANGLNMENKTRGFTNRSVGSSVFTSTDNEEYAEGSYGDAQFAINTQAMKKDGLTPYVGMEPDVMEVDLRNRLANLIGVDNYDAEVDSSAGTSPNTVIVYGAIPAKYLEQTSDYPESVEASQSSQDDDELVYKFNPNHDKVGRFSTSPGGSMPFDGDMHALQQHYAAFKKTTKSVADEVARVMGFPVERIDIADTVKFFKVDGKAFALGGEYNPTSGFITLYPHVISDEDSIAGLMAHEITHAAFGAVMARFNKELGEISKDPKEKNTVDTGFEIGLSSPEAKAKWPVFDKIQQFMYDPLSARTLTETDGVTPYSTQYWEGYRKNSLPFQQAVNETLAEISKLEWKGLHDGNTLEQQHVAPRWIDFHTTLMELYQNENHQS